LEVANALSIRALVGVPGQRASNDSAVFEKIDFQGFRVSSLPYEMGPTLLYGII